MAQPDHGHHPPEGHIPPPDLPRERRILGFKPLHVVIGAIVLVVILILYLLLTARTGY